MKARIVIVLVFLVAIVAVVVMSRGGSEPEGPGVAGPPPSRVTVRMVYSTEKKEWIEAAAVEFAVAHPEIALDLKGMGSLAAAEAILEGSEKPAIFSPADSLILSMLASDWDTKFHTPLLAASGEDAPDPLVISPFVFVAWADRAAVLEKAGGGSIGWKSIHDAVASNQGWPAIGGKAEWGFVKLGHTDPTQSNSGLQALLLMTMEYYGKTNGLQVADVLDPKYQTWVKEVEGGVGKFEYSTGTFMTDMVRFGPSKYDIAGVYESLAIAQIGNAQGRWGDLKVYYPSTTIWSDHPAGVLQLPEVTEEVRAAARIWLAFLRSQPVQQRALSFGFRPGNPAVPLQSNDANNPFVKFAPYGVRVDIPPVATPPDGVVVRNLLTMWSRVVGAR